METDEQVTLAAPPVNIIEEGGYRIDADTGEVLGLVERVEKWQPTDVSGVAWVLDKMQRCDADAVAIELRRKAINAMLDADAKRVQNRRDYLDMMYTNPAEDVARLALACPVCDGTGIAPVPDGPNTDPDPPKCPQCEGSGFGKTKTLKTDFGKLAFSRTQGKIEVVDAAKAVEYCREEVKCPDCGDSPTVACDKCKGIGWVERYPEAIKTPDPYVLVTPLKSDAALLPSDIFNYIPPREKFTIDTGISIHWKHIKE